MESIDLTVFPLNSIRDDTISITKQTSSYTEPNKLAVRVWCQVAIGPSITNAGPVGPVLFLLALACMTVAELLSEPSTVPTKPLLNFVRLGEDYQLTPAIKNGPRWRRHKTDDGDWLRRSLGDAQEASWDLASAGDRLIGLGLVRIHLRRGRAASSTAGWDLVRGNGDGGWRCLGEKGGMRWGGG